MLNTWIFLFIFLFSFIFYIKENKNMILRYLISFLICGIIGVIAHFLYNLFNKNKISLAWGKL